MIMQGTPLFSGSDQIESLRYLGLTTTDAVNELVDNSFDADCNNIYISVFEENSKVSIVIEDDGKGIPKDKIDKILSFGGRIANNQKITTGRFGWGLPSSACCQTKRAELYSITNNEWYYSYIDLEELSKQENALIPKAKEKLPPKKICSKLDTDQSGTIIYLKECDNLEYKKVKTIIKHLSENLGEIHRYFLNKGKHIYINGEAIVVNDPLMLMDNCRNTDVLGKGNEYVDIKPIVVKDEIDPETGKPAEINIRISLLNLQHIRKNIKWKKITKKHKINQDNQGFYLIRHNRQIARAQTFNLFNRHNSYNYFRGEISFPPVLDKYFGVQTNKSRFSLSSEIKDLIYQKVTNPLSQIKKQTEDWKDKNKAETDKEGRRTAEIIVLESEKELKNNTYTPTSKQLEKEKKELEKLKEKEIQKTLKDKKLNSKDKKEKISEIKNRFQFQRPFKRVLENNSYGPFYYVKPKGKSTEVVINVSHLFYKEIYEKAVNKQLDVFIDLLIFTLSKAELMYYEKEDVRKFYENQRVEWSTILKTYLEKCREY